MKRKNHYSDSKPIGYLLLILSFFVIPILLFIYSGMNAFNEFKSFPDQPQHTTLAASLSLLANKRAAWVIIDDIMWDCDHISQETQVSISHSNWDHTVHTTMHIPFTNKQHNIFGETRLTDDLTLTCDEIKSQEVVGVLLSPKHDLMMSSQLFYAGFFISDYTVYGTPLYLCHTCGKNAAAQDLIISIAMILIFLLPIIFILFRFYTLYVV